MVPAWMAELSEEWVEPVEDAERVDALEADEADQGRHRDGGHLDFGSLAIDDMPLPSPSQASLDGGQFGTTVFRDAHPPAEHQDEQSCQMGSMLFSPSKKRSSSCGRAASDPASPNGAPSPGQQLAMAAAAFNKDLLHNHEDSQLQDTMDPSSSIQAKPKPADRLKSLFQQPQAAESARTSSIQNRSAIHDIEEQQQGQAQGRREHYEEAGEPSFIVDQQLEDIAIATPPDGDSPSASRNPTVSNNTRTEVEETQEVEAGPDRSDEQASTHALAPAAPSPAGAIASQSHSKISSNLVSQLPSTDFSFRVEPKLPPKLLSSYLEGVFTDPSQGQDDEPLQESRGIATSTPSTSKLAVQQFSSPSNPASRVEPPTSPKNRHSQRQSAQPSPALSIFKFQQDTYTRQHLQALVAEIDGLTSPPRNNSLEPAYTALDLSGSQFGETSDMLAASRKGMYRQSITHNDPSMQTFEYSYHTAHVEQDEQNTDDNAPYERILEVDEDDENGRVANTRSSKRVRLSASDNQPRYQHQQEPSRMKQNLLSQRAALSPFRTRIQNRVMPRTTTPIRRRTQRAPYSASSRLQYSQRADVSIGQCSNTSSTARPPLRSLPPMTAPVRRSYHSSMAHKDDETSIPEQDTEPEGIAPLETPPSRWHRTDAVTPREVGKTPAHIVQDRLQEAKALMERIRHRNTQRQASTSSQVISGSAAVLVPGSDKSPIIAVTPDSAESYLGDSALKRRPLTRQGTLTRPTNPTPTTAALAYQMRGNHRVIEQMATTPEEEEPTYMEGSASMELRGNSESRGATTPDEERLDSLAPLPTINTNNQLSKTKIAMGRGQLSSSPLVQQNMTAGFASPAPQHHLQIPRYSALSAVSHSSSDRFFTSTSSRYVSGSTAPTSLAASSAGTTKGHNADMHRGIVNITPAEAQDLLTEDVLGDMIFDDVHKKWVKIDNFLASRAGAIHPGSMQDPATRQVPALSPVEEMPGGDSENTADDPFRDLTGIENSKNLSLSGKLYAVQKHSRSESLVPPLSTSQASVARSEEEDRQTEKTSTPPHQISVALPFVSPDLPSIPQVSSSSQMSNGKIPSEGVASHQSTTTMSRTSENGQADQRISSGTSGPPKSVLKRSDANAYSTPLPCSKLISRISSKQTRSVSFSDGKLPGRGGNSLDTQQAKVASSALRNEISSSQLSDNDTVARDYNACSREEAAFDHIRYQAQDLDPLYSNASAGVQASDSHSQYEQASRSAVLRHTEHDTPTASYTSYAKPRSLRLKSRMPANLANSMMSTTSTLAWHRKPLNANATILTECSFGVSYDRLLRVLTDVVPFEPSWQDLERINLRERGLESVVRLKEFLPNLDAINLSDNNIAYLTGLPSSLRFLSLANNRLGDLSSFAHLKNLESLDISGNTGVTSVRQLACLRHLRTLNADGCGIDSIEGIDQLDGLVTLSMCNNSIDRLHLDRTAWTRLETLEVSDNNILEVIGLETLSALRTLNLDYNRLQELSLSAAAPNLRIIKISNNSLNSLDLAQMPNVRTVFADSNRITSISGTCRLKKLENLSLREQRYGTIDFPVKDLRDIRRLYLSNNPIPEAFPNEHFLNLTLLELSGCRLTSLPADFAVVVPNCRVLILDSNFLTTLAPVAGAKRLRVLSAVGNRLDKVKDLLSIWLECTELETLDLRLNPVTLGFYASPNLSVAPPNLNLLASEDNVAMKTYKALDTQHRHTLPNEWLARRTAYRALIIEAVPRLRVLDGLRVGRTQRQRARELVETFAS